MLFVKEEIPGTDAATYEDGLPDITLDHNLEHCFIEPCPINCHPWIPVTVDLPQVDGKFWVVAQHQARRHQFAVMYSRQYGWLETIGVTHWMPMARMPREE